MSHHAVGAMENQKPASEQWLALIAIILGAFVAVLNNSLINVAIPRLVVVFGSTTERMQWVLTGYMLASAVVIPMSGFLGDRFGYKKVILLSLSLFTVGSLLCGMAWNDTSLIAFRIFQGLSGGFIMPLSMAIIYMMMPRNQIGLALGIWGIASMAAPAVGPTLSGYVLEYFNWRLLFFINIPFGIFAVIMGSFILRETPARKEMAFDVGGAILSVVMFGSLMLALNEGQTKGWTSFYIVGLFFVTFFSGLLLLWTELNQKDPIFDFRLFKNVTFTLSTITSGFVMIGLFGGVFLIPLYVQNIQGLSPSDTGLLLMPQSVAMALMMPLSGRLYDKIGVVPLGLVGLGLLSVTTFELHRLALDTPNDWLTLVLTIRGMGIGLCMMPLATAGMNAVPRTMTGKASSVSNVIRQVMGSFGIAVLTTIMVRRQAFHGTRISESVTLTSDVARQTLDMMTAGLVQSGVDAGTATGTAYNVLYGLISKEALVRAIADAFLVSSLPLFFALPLVFFFNWKKPSRMISGTTPTVTENRPPDIQTET